MNKKKATAFFLLVLAVVIVLLVRIDDLENNPEIITVVKEKIVTIHVPITVPMPIKVESEPIIVEVAPEPIYKISQSEREMLARLIYLEGGSTSKKCQKMILSVVINRWQASGGSLENIVYAAEQFTPATKIWKTTPKEVQYEVVDEILFGGSILPYYVQSFRAGHYHTWSGYREYAYIDNVYFGYFDRDK